jgi:hypothetical protein
MARLCGKDERNKMNENGGSMKEEQGEFFKARSNRGLGVSLNLPRCFLVDILRRRCEDFLGGVRAHKFIFVVIVLDDAKGDDCENTEHPQKYTDAASY